MGGLGLHFPGALSALLLPVNLVALLAGILAGVLAARLVTRAGLELAVLFALLFPIAALLDPATGLILLGSGWAAALVTTAPAARMWHVLVVAIVLLLAAAVFAGPAATLLPKLVPVEKVALLVVAGALAVLMAAGSRTDAWLFALVLAVLGVALELSPLQPLDGAKASPRALLLGLLAMGPALVTLLRPHVLIAMAPPGEAFDKAATVLPLLVFAMPVTLTASLFTLALGEHGLTAGHTLMTQRPRLALSLALALVVASVAAGLVLVAWRAAAQRFSRPAWVSQWDGAQGTRLCAAIVIVLAGGLLFRLGIERGEGVILLVAACAGGALHWLGRSPAPLIIGLTIGEVMRPALAPALKAGVADQRAAVIVALAVLASLAALTWPWLRRSRRATVG